MTIVIDGTINGASGAASTTVKLQLMRSTKRRGAALKHDGC
jgi:hypothetical protein